MRYFETPYKNTVLKGTIYGSTDPRVFCIHGASETGSVRFDMLRHHLARVGIASAAFDFIGAGQTGGDMSGRILEDRLSQARAVVGSIHLQKPLIIIGLGMGADTALRLTQYYPTSTLILCVPAFFPEDILAPFEIDFCQALQNESDRKESRAWDILREFSGSLFVIGAEHDQYAPEGIYDMIDQVTPNVKYKELYTIPGAPHRILPYLSDHPAQFAEVFERVYHAIIHSQ
ncbi:alpha/beta hydrolase [Candidatus Uhrbacteria bacterium]|nr:alpha/beta hydrolase [Candidatus Uhrbacteria bacterium]